MLAATQYGGGSGDGGDDDGFIRNVHAISKKRMIHPLRQRHKSGGGRKKEKR